MSREKIARKPSSATSQPMTSRVLGNVYSPDAAIFGPVPPLHTTAAAAPSPNSAVATMLLLVRSSRRNHSAHNSTTKSNTFDPGIACAIIAARARPTAPPTQPKPKIGKRRIVREKPRRSTRRASRLGVAIPVVDTTTTASTSAAVSEARASASRVAPSSKVCAVSRYSRCDPANCARRSTSRSAHTSSDA